jgi:hypothetical protein
MIGIYLKADFRNYYQAHSPPMQFVTIFGRYGVTKSLSLGSRYGRPLHLALWDHLDNVLKIDLMYEACF